MKYSCRRWGNGWGPSSECGALFNISMMEPWTTSSSMALPARSPYFNNVNQYHWGNGTVMIVRECYIGDAVPLKAVVILGAVVTAPRPVGIERVQIRKVVEIEARCVENVAILTFAENGARLPRSICKEATRSVTILWNIPAVATRWKTVGAFEPIAQFNERFINMIRRSSGLVLINIDIQLSKSARELVTKWLPVNLDCLDSGRHYERGSCGADARKYW